jgi:hypothetical protein
MGHHKVRQIYEKKTEYQERSVHDEEDAKCKGLILVAKCEVREKRGQDHSLFWEPTRAGRYSGIQMQNCTILG